VSWESNDRIVLRQSCQHRNAPKHVITTFPKAIVQQALNFIIFLLFGGLQTLAGPILGAVVLTALPEALRFASESRLIIYGAVIVAVMLLRPDGLLRRSPLGQRRHLFGLTLRPARRPHGRLAGEDVLGPTVQ